MRPGAVPQVFGPGAGGMTAPAAPKPGLWAAWRLRHKRRRLLWRSFRSRHGLRALSDRTAALRPGAILAVATVRDEAARLPHFLNHHRALGVDHFLMIDNDSSDGSAEFLAAQPDVSVWHTGRSYRAARFGLDWMTWLQMRHAHGHWCLMLDADETLIYPHHDRLGLRALTDRLSATGQKALGALMLDLYPQGPVDRVRYQPGQDPAEVLDWFDPGPYRAVRQQPLGNLWVQGGARERVFFADRPRQSPTLNKIPLVRWSRRFAYVNSAHSALPPRLNHAYDGPGAPRCRGFCCTASSCPRLFPDRRSKLTGASIFPGHRISPGITRLCRPGRTCGVRKAGGCATGASWSIWA